MAVTLVETIGSASANTYATLAEADSYMESHVYSTDWDAATDPEKNTALAMACRTLDAMFDWAGAATDTTQALRWPRVGIRAANELEFVDDDEIPEELKWAQIELANALIKSDRTADSDIEVNKITSLSAGPVSLSFGAGVTAKVIPDSVWYLIPEWWGVSRARRKSVREVFRG